MKQRTFDSIHKVWEDIEFSFFLNILIKVKLSRDKGNEFMMSWTPQSQM